MPIRTIVFANANDHHVSCTTTTEEWAAVYAGTGTLSLSITGSNTMQFGARFVNTSPPNYGNAQCFLLFDTSVGTVWNSARLELVQGLARDTSSEVLHARQFTWSTAATGNYRSASQLAALPLVASGNVSWSIVTGRAFSFPFTQIPPSTTNYRLVLHSERQITGEGIQASSTSWNGFHSSEASGTVNDPILVLVQESADGVFANPSNNGTSANQFIVPPLVSSITIDAYGGGGGGGPAQASQKGGGGGGAYATTTISVTPGETYTITVGAGGAVGAAGADSSVTRLGTTHCLAKGGGAGSNSAAAPGGQASACVGDFAYSGGQGAAPQGGGGSRGGSGGGGSADDYGGGGNGAAGSAGLGGDGGLGARPFGGAGGRGGDGGGAASVGAAPGGGGGGGGSSSGASASGAAGKVVISYFQPDVEKIAVDITTVNATETASLMRAASASDAVSVNVADSVGALAKNEPTLLYFNGADVGAVESVASGGIVDSANPFTGQYAFRVDGATTWVTSTSWQNATVTALSQTAVSGYFSRASGNLFTLATNQGVEIVSVGYDAERRIQISGGTVPTTTGPTVQPTGFQRVSIAHSNAVGGAVKVWVNGVLEIDIVRATSGSATGAVNSSGSVSDPVWVDNLIVTNSITDPGDVRIIARQGRIGTPTNDAFTKAPAGSAIHTVWSDTPVNTATNATSSAANAAQTMLVGEFGSGADAITSSDKVLGVRQVIHASRGGGGGLDVSWRRIVNGQTTDTLQGALASGNTYYQYYWPVNLTLSDLSTAEMGLVRGNGTSQATTVHDMWLVVAYRKSSANTVDKSATDSVSVEISETALRTIQTVLSVNGVGSAEAVGSPGILQTEVISLEGEGIYANQLSEDAFAGSASNDSSLGTIAWSNPVNAVGATDAQYAVASLSASNPNSQYLKVTDFGFDLVPGSQVQGVRVTVRRVASGNIVDNSVRLVVGGSIVGENKAVGGAWGTTPHSATYGAEDDAWGLTLFGSDVVGSNFGVVIAASRGAANPSASIDSVRVEVFAATGVSEQFTVTITESPNLDPVGIVSAADLGVFSISPGVRSLSLLGVPTQEALGSPVLLRGAITLSALGVESASATGAPALQTGAAQILPGGLPSQETPGFPAVQIATSLSLLGVSTQEFFGSPVLLRGAITLSALGVQSASATGTFALQAGAAQILPGGLTSQETLGLPAVQVAALLSLLGAPTQESFGSPVLLRGALTLSALGVQSASATGTPALQAGATSLPLLGAPTQESFGSPVLLRGAITLSALGVESASAAGTPDLLAGAVQILPGGLPSQETSGFPAVKPEAFSLSLLGAPTQEALGSPVLLRGAITLSALGVESASATGAPALQAGAAQILPGGLPSQETPGSPSFGTVSTVSILGAPSEESLGTPLAASGGVTVSAAGVGSAAMLGSPTVSVEGAALQITGIASALSTGLAALSAGESSLQMVQVSSGVAVSQPGVAAGGATVLAEGVLSSEIAGSPSVGGGTAFLSAEGLQSAEWFGDAALSAGEAVIGAGGVSSAFIAGLPSFGADGSVVAPDSIGSAFASGVPQISAGHVFIGVQGVAPAELVPSPYLASFLTVPALGVGGASAAGQPTIQAGVAIIAPTGSASSTAFGVWEIAPGAVSISSQGVVSAEAFGNAQFSSVIDAAGVESAAVFGQFEFGRSLPVAAIASAENFGPPVFGGNSQAVSVTGKVSGNTFGAFTFRGTFARSYVTGDANIGNWVDGGQSAIAVTSSTANGVQLQMTSVNQTLTEWALSPSGETWQSWGVPPGYHVLSVELTGAVFSVATVARLSSHNVSLAIRDASGNIVHGQPLLDTTALPTTATTSTNPGAPYSAQTVDEAYRNSSTSVRFRLIYTCTTTAQNNPNVTVRMTSLNVRITAQDASLGLNMLDEGIGSGEVGGLFTVDAKLTFLPSPVGSAAVVASPVVSIGQTTGVLGVGSSVVFGFPSLDFGDLALDVGGVPSAMFSGNPGVVALASVAPTAILSGETAGIAALSPGGVSISLEGVASAEAFAPPDIVRTTTLSASGIDTAAMFGVVIVDPSAHVAVNGIESAAATGSPNIAGGLTISPEGVASFESAGGVVFRTAAVVLPSGAIGSEATGTPVLSAGGFSASLVGIPSQTAVASPRIEGFAWINPLGGTSGETSGLPNFDVGTRVFPVSVGSAASTGSPLLSAGGISASVIGVASGSAVASPGIASSVVIAGQGLESAQSPGIPFVSSSSLLAPQPIAAAGAFGAPSFSAGGISVQIDGVSSLESAGLPVFRSGASFTPTGVASSETTASPALLVSGRILAVIGALSSAAVGLPSTRIVVSVSADGIASAEQIAAPSLSSFAGVAVGPLQDAPRVGMPLVVGDSHQRIASVASARFGPSLGTVAFAFFPIYKGRFVVASNPLFKVIGSANPLATISMAVQKAIGGQITHRVTTDSISVKVLKLPTA
jgi:hypothetical protein